MVKISTTLPRGNGRGGARPGAGRKKSAVKEKAENGNPGADWKCWIFSKSRVSICQSPMSFYLPSGVTGVRSKRRKSFGLEKYHVGDKSDGWFSNSDINGNIKGDTEKVFKSLCQKKDITALENQ